MPVRNAEARWNGDLLRGNGTMKVGSGAFQGAFSFGTRMENTPGTNPEELIAAAHAGCFSMALSAVLGKAGFTPTSIETSAAVHLDKVGDGFKITRSVLTTRGKVPKLDQAGFKQHAETAKKNCPVSQALAGVQIELEASLEA
jgi:osmotically inducible protein OsmC